MPAVSIDLPPYAKGLYEPGYRYRVLYGGRGGARSWTFARRLLQRGLDGATRALCAREIQNSIKDSVHRLLSDQIELLGLSLYYQVLEREIRGPKDTLILFEGIRHNPTRIKSLEGINVAWVEEAERITNESWNVLIPTIRREDSEIWVSFNTNLEDDPTYQRFVVHPPPRTWVKKVSGDDNPWLPDVLKEERAHLYAVDPDAADNVWGGNCRKSSEAEILKGKWFVEEFDPQPDWNGPYHGLDFGFALNPTVASKLWESADGTVLYVEREASKVGLELDDTTEFILRHIPEADGYVMRADNARPESISYLKRHGLPKIVPCTKWPGSIEDGISHLRQYRRIVIHPRCQRAVFEAKNYEYEKDKRTGDPLPKVRDLHNDFWDSARYGLGPLIRRRATRTVSTPSSGSIRLGR